MNNLIIFMIGWFIGCIIYITVKIFFEKPKSKKQKEECIFCSCETGNQKYKKDFFLSTTKIVPVCKNHKLSNHILKFCNNVADINYQYYKKYLDFIFDQRQRAKGIDKYHYEHLERLKDLDQEFKIKNKVKGEIEKL